MIDKKSSALLRPMVNKSIVDRIMARLTDTILSGELKPGEKIPTESELAESLGVGRNSVREAVKSLVAMGVLNIRRSEGTFVAKGFSDRMLEPMIYGMILEGGNSPAVIELRYLVDSGILQLAVQKADAHDTRELRRCLDNLRIVVQTEPTRDALQEADIAFHKQLEKIVDNPLISKISIVIERISRPSRNKAVDSFIEAGRLDRFIQLHESICKLVESKDLAQIGDVMDEHFSAWREEFV